MFSTDLYIDRILPDRRLADVFGPAFDARPDQVAVIPNELLQQVADAWKSSNMRLVLRTSLQAGSFPLVLGLLLRESKPADIVRRLEKAAVILGASLLTDEALINALSDSEYLLVGADGQSEIVHIDTADWDSEIPTFELVPASQRIHRTHSVGEFQHAG